MRQAVLERDQGCVARLFFPVVATGRVAFHGTTEMHYDECAGKLTLDHVQDGYGRMGKRAPSDPAHLVTLCAHHHLDGWATSHRPELRAYLEAVS